MPKFPAALRDILVGNPFGEVYPERKSPPFRPIEGRTAALRILRRYIAELTFYRAGPLGGLPIAFQIAAKNIYIERPDAIEDEVYPSIGVLPGTGNYETIGLVSYVLEETKDKYGRGTVLCTMSEYNEVFNLEIKASSKAERRAVISGLEVALVPTEYMYGIRFRMTEYFDQVVCFTLNNRQLIEDDDASRNRRRVLVNIEMRHNIVALINVEELRPSILVEVEDGKC